MAAAGKSVNPVEDARKATTFHCNLLTGPNCQLTHPLRAGIMLHNGFKMHSLPILREKFPPSCLILGMGTMMSMTTMTAYSATTAAAAFEDHRR